MKAVKRRTVAPKTMPSKPGLYYWSEWKCVVEVVQRGKMLFVTPPNGIEVKITPNIAGRFVEQS